MTVANLSNNHVTKCGKLLRDHPAKRQAPDPAEWQHAIDVVTEFRSLHASPMSSVRNGLGAMLRSKSLNIADAAISQRHKRVERIVRKLRRMPHTSLHRLEDIGGCRVLLQRPEDLTALRDRIVARWEEDFTREPRDYIANPKDIGYRAVHFVVKRDGRAIEIQLRTVGQQAWADELERLDGRLASRPIPDTSISLKDGLGPDSILEYFSAAGAFIYHQEYGLQIPSDLLERLRLAQDAVIDAGYYSRPKGN